MYYTIKPSDIGKWAIRAFGKSWIVADFIGHILARDVGKRVYKVGAILQVESDKQRAKRLAGATEGG